MILALAIVAGAPPLDRREAMERCAEAVIAKRHPGGMVDVTGIGFEWLSVSGTGDDQVIIGSITEPQGKGRIARRFTCRLRAMKPPNVSFQKIVRL